MMIADKCYTITQASQRLPDILKFVEQGHAVELTRQGKAVAMVVSITAYQSLYEQSHRDFWQALQEFRQTNQDMRGFAEWHEALTDVRETTPGREMTW